jgi:hypothetical protein
MIVDYFRNGADKPHFAVWPDDSVLHIGGPCTLTDLAVGFLDSCAVLRVDIAEKARKAPRQFFRHSKDPKNLLGPMDRVGFNVAFPTPDLGETLRLGEPELTSPQPLFD